MKVTVSGLVSLDAKLAAIPASVIALVDGANDQNADEFMAHVSAIVPRGEAGDAHPGALAESLAKGPGEKPHSVKVSIGGPEAPYPAHLEYGHMAPGGVHVHAEPFWWTTWRVLKRRFKSRASRAGTAAIRRFKGASNV